MSSGEPWLLYLGILQRNIKTTARGAKRINESDPPPHKTTSANNLICVLWNWKGYCIVFLTFVAVVCLKCNLACFYFEGEFTLLTGSCCCYGNKKSFTAGGTRHKVRPLWIAERPARLWAQNSLIIHTCTHKDSHLYFMIRKRIHTCISGSTLVFFNAHTNVCAFRIHVNKIQIQKKVSCTHFALSGADRSMEPACRC